MSSDAASQNLHELIAAAINGEEIIITKDEQPVVKLTPVIPQKNVLLYLVALKI